MYSNLDCSTEHMDIYCRTCLKEDDVMVHMDEEVEELDNSLRGLVEICSGLEMRKDDPHPSYLCKDCIGELLVAAKFREKCIKTQRVLDGVAIESEPAVQNPDDTVGCVNDLESNIIEFDPDEFIVMEVPESTTLVDTATDVDPKQDILYLPEEHTDSDSNSLCLEIDETTTIIENHTVQNEQPMNSIYGYAETINVLRNGKSFAFVCDLCGASFVESYNLKRHLSNAHSLEQFPVCPKCEHSFSDQTKCDQHLADGCNGKELRSPVNSNSASRGGHLCPYCNKLCMNDFALKMHMRVHTDERPYQCELCPKAFKTNSAFRAHMNRHSGMAQFSCSVCSKSFFDSSNLRRHMILHTGEKPHTCSICRKRFSRVFLLQLHMRTHTGEKPYKCQYCQRAFSQVSDWKYHVRSLHEGNLPYKCSVCGKSFGKRKLFEQHQYLHPVKDQSIEGHRETPVAALSMEEADTINPMPDIDYLVSISPPSP